MKFEDYLMRPGDDKQTRLDLEKEVEELQAELDKEKAIKKALYSALHGPIPTNPCLPSFFPPQAKGLLAEIRMVGDEIAWLEKKVDELKLSLYEQKKQNKEWTVKKQQRRKLRQHNNLPPFSPGKSIMSEDCCELSRSQHFQEYKEEKVHLRRVSVGSAGEMFSFSSPVSNKENSRRHSGRTQEQQNIHREFCSEIPNELSEELLRCLMDMFLRLNRESGQGIISLSSKAESFLHELEKIKDLIQL